MSQLTKIFVAISLQIIFIIFILKTFSHSKPYFSITFTLTIKVLCCVDTGCVLINRDKLEEDKEFDVVGDLSELQAKPREEKSTDQNGATADHQDGEYCYQVNTVCVH